MLLMRIMFFSLSAPCFCAFAAATRIVDEKKPKIYESAYAQGAGMMFV